MFIEDDSFILNEYHGNSRFGKLICRLRLLCQHTGLEPGGGPHLLCNIDKEHSVM